MLPPTDSDSQKTPLKLTFNRDAADQSVSTILSNVFKNTNIIEPSILNSLSSVHTYTRFSDKLSSTYPKTSKYCYRHSPDKCLSRTDISIMKDIQNELSSMSDADQHGISYVWSLFSVASPVQKNLILRGLLAQCCFPQLSVVSAIVRDLIKIDFISALPSELALRILCQLDSLSLCNASRVNRKWHKLADDDFIWQRMCEQHIDRKCLKCGWALPLLEPKRSLRKKQHLFNGGSSSSPSTHHDFDLVNLLFNAGSSSHKRLLHDSDDDISRKRLCKYSSVGNDSIITSDATALNLPKRYWKDIYRDRFKIGINWKHARYKLKVLEGYNNGIMCLQLLDNILAAGSYDASIKIWNVDTGIEVRKLEGHTSGVRCLQFDCRVLMSGSLDGTIMVWNWRTGECIRTFSDFGGGIIGLSFVGNYIASSSTDRTIRIWDTEKQRKFCLRGHTDWVNGIKIDAASRTIFSVSDDTTVCMWDLDSHRCLRKFQAHVGPVQQVVLLPPEFEIDKEELDTLLKWAVESRTNHPQSSSYTVASSTTSISETSQNQPALPSSSPAPPLLATESSSESTSTQSVDRSELEISPLFPGHPQYKNSRPSPPRFMLTSSLDSTICLWDVLYGVPLRKFFGHLEGIWALAADKLRIISGSEDRTVKIWDPHTGRCEHTYTGHDGPVTCVALSDDKLVSGGEDGLVRVLEFSC